MENVYDLISVATLNSNKSQISIRNKENSINEQNDDDYCDFEYNIDEILNNENGCNSDLNNINNIISNSNVINSNNNSEINKINEEDSKNPSNGCPNTNEYQHINSNGGIINAENGLRINQITSNNELNNILSKQSSKSYNTLNKTDSLIPSKTYSINTNEILDETPNSEKSKTKKTNSINSNNTEILTSISLEKDNNSSNNKYYNEEEDDLITFKFLNMDSLLSLIGEIEKITKKKKNLINDKEIALENKKAIEILKDVYKSLLMNYKQEEFMIFLKNIIRQNQEILGDDKKLELLNVLTELTYNYKINIGLKKKYQKLLNEQPHVIKSTLMEKQLTEYKFECENLKQLNSKIDKMKIELEKLQKKLNINKDKNEQENQKLNAKYCVSNEIYLKNSIEEYDNLINKLKEEMNMK